jgi:hypothetical protein
MKLILALIIGLGTVSPAGADDIEIMPQMTAVERVKITADCRYPWYKMQYPYMIMVDTVFSAESEFEWPKGFARIAEKKLTQYQNWVGHLPLWHSQRPVGTLYSGFKFKPEQIARPIHLTRWKTKFSDKTIAVHLWAQYLEVQTRFDDLKVCPTVGDTLTYRDFLSGTLAYGSRGQVVYTKTDKRPASHDEFASFMELCDQQITYKGLAEQCLPVAKDSLLPGDMYVTFHEEGIKGKVIFLLTGIVDGHGNKLFLIGEGCDEECDFHIPLLNGDKNYPWISVDQIAALYLPMAHAGYFRPRIK